MGKILFWFIIILAVLIGARLLSRSVGKQPEAGQLGRDGKVGKATKADMSNAEEMVRCQQCGIHLPRSEAYMSQGKTWCGPEHARIGLKSSE